MINFILQFSFITEEYQEDILNKCFEINTMYEGYGFSEYSLHTDVNLV